MILGDYYVHGWTYAGTDLHRFVGTEGEALELASLYRAIFGMDERAGVEIRRNRRGSDATDLVRRWVNSPCGEDGIGWIVAEEGAS